MRIATRLALGFGFLILLLVAAVSTTIYQTLGFERTIYRIADVRAPTAVSAAVLAAGLSETQSALRGYLLTGRANFSKERAAAWMQVDRSVEALAQVAPQWSSEGDRKQWADFLLVLTDFRTAQDQAESVANPSDPAESLTVLVSEVGPRANKLLTLLAGNMQSDGARSGGLADSHAQLLSIDARKAVLAVETLLSVQWVLVATGTVVGGLISFVTASAISRPLASMTSAMQRLSQGDLEVVVAADRRDELGRMAEAVDVFRTNALLVRDLDEARQRRADLDAEQAKGMASLLECIFNVFTLAGRGDFSGRVECNLNSPGLERVAGGINELLATIEHGLQETGEVLAAISQADLRARVKGDYLGAFLQLKTDVNSVGDRLTAILSTLRSTSAGLRGATTELLTGAEDLGRRTHVQATALETTADNMRQLSATVSTNAVRAADANAKVRGVVLVTETAAGSMSSAQKAMGLIAASSGKIANVISLIDDIAFQTNLLALNASVEAARAGAAGSGFAIVAAEVRRLAQSTAQASAEVKKLVEQSRLEVTEGSRSVEDAASKMSIMLDGFSVVVDLMSQITQASVDQSTAIKDVVGAVAQLDTMTTQNAALVEETNTALALTERQAAELDRVVGIFKLGDATVEQRPSTRLALAG